MSKSASAQQLLDSEAFNDSFDYIRNQLIDQLERGPKTQEGQDLCVTSLQLLSKLKQYIVSVADNDKVENFLQEHKKRFGGYSTKY